MLFQVIIYTLVKIYFLLEQSVKFYLQNLNMSGINLIICQEKKQIQGVPNLNADIFRLNTLCR